LGQSIRIRLENLLATNLAKKYTKKIQNNLAGIGLKNVHEVLGQIVGVIFSANMCVSKPLEKQETTGATPSVLFYPSPSLPQYYLPKPWQHRYLRT
jgi:hypothetical protein